MSEGQKDTEKYKIYAIGYANPNEAMQAEFTLFNAIKNFIETVELEPGKFAKILRANIALDSDMSHEEVMREEKRIIMPVSAGSKLVM